MKPLIDPINTSDGKFHGKDKQTGDLATIVTPEYMNNDQDATRSMQREIISILTAAGINPEEATDTQLLSALKKVLITADDERVKNALQKESNLSDVTDAAKALANIGGVPTTRKINGHALNADANITAQDIFNGQAVAIGNAIDLNTLQTPGLYFQAANAQAASGKNYPEAVAGSLEVYKHAGITQVYRVYNNSRQYARTLYSGTWSAWSWVYDTTHKPGAGDVGALPITGGNVTGAVSFGGAKKFSINPQNNATLDARLNHWGNTDRPTVLEFGDATSYHFYSQRNKDGSIIFTCAGTINPSIWTNFDARYQAKGSYTPAGEAYTKAQSDGKYPTAFRVGSRVTYNGSDFGGKVPQGAVNINNYTNNDDRINGVVYAYLQFYLNGKWVNFS
jgi:hypothetical protein